MNGGGGSRNGVRKRGVGGETSENRVPENYQKERGSKGAKNASDQSALVESREWTK